MGIVGFSFSKLECERREVKTNGKNIEINHNISIIDINKTELNVGIKKEEVLKIDFSFSIIYGNSLGEIKINGDIIFSDVKAIIDETFKSWQLNKKINDLINEEVLSFIYSKSIIKALEISDSLSLPSPIPLPKFNFSSKENK